MVAFRVRVAEAAGGQVSTVQLVEQNRSDCAERQKPLEYFEQECETNVVNEVSLPFPSPAGPFCLSLSLSTLFSCPLPSLCPPKSGTREVDTW
jgi:hypothetical protein